MPDRPPFIAHWRDFELADDYRYPGSNERLSISANFGRAFGLKQVGLNHELLPPGRRTSWPHAERDEEEFVFVIEGTPDVWIDGVLYRLQAGDAVGFPAGTGICHTFINNGERDARVLVGGERDRSDNRIYYPLHPGRRHDMPWSHWWDDIPLREQGPHDGLPDALRGPDEAGTSSPVR